MSWSTREVPRFVERAFAALGISALLIALAGYGLMAYTEARLHGRVFADVHASGASISSLPWSPLRATIGRLTIPQIGLDAPIVEGSSPLDLMQAAGHIAGTSTAGAAGTSAYAGHRDTFFRPLERVRPGMRVSFQNVTGSHEYVVEETVIVKPSDLTVLAPAQKQRLVLITCYPFHFIGPAPKRFVVISSRLP